jgi:hypothetical protein
MSLDSDMAPFSRNRTMANELHHRKAARGAVWVCLVPYHQGREPGWTWLERKGRSPPWE